MALIGRLASEVRISRVWPGWSHLPRDARDTLFLLFVIGWTVLPHASHLPVCGSTIVLSSVHTPPQLRSLKWPHCSHTCVAGLTSMLLPMHLPAHPRWPARPHASHLLVVGFGSVLLATQVPLHVGSPRYPQRTHVSLAASYAEAVSHAKPRAHGGRPAVPHAFAHHLM